MTITFADGTSKYVPAEEITNEYYDMTSPSYWKKAVQESSWLQQIFCDPVTVEANIGWNVQPEVTREQFDDLLRRVELLELQRAGLA